MIIDLHCHSRFSGDNVSDPQDIIHYAMKTGLDGVCFTEHDSYEISQPVEKIKVPDSFKVFRGVELTTNEGHLLIFGISNDFWKLRKITRLDLETIIREVHDEGGICVPAHPFRGWLSIGEIIYNTTGFDAIETQNGANLPEQNIRAVQSAVKLGLHTIGGSDCHRPSDVGRCYTQFPHRIDCLSEMIKAIRAGNCQARIRSSKLFYQEYI